MFTSAVILACLFEIINVPHAEAIPIGLAHDDIGPGYGFISPDEVRHIDNREEARTVHPSDHAQYDESGWIRIILMIFKSACYVASVKTRNIRNKMMLIMIGAILSFLILLF